MYKDQADIVDHITSDDHEEIMNHWKKIEESQKSFPNVVIEGFPTSPNKAQQ